MTTESPSAMNKESAQADLAFLRQLVDGDFRPGLWGFGAIYVAIGLAIAAQIVVTDYIELVVPLPEWTTLPGMIAVWVAYSIVQHWIGRRMKAMGGVGPLSSLRMRASGAAFIGMVLSHLVMLAVFLVLTVRMQDGLYLTFAALSFFAVQAAMWVVLHAMSRHGWQLVEALAWLVAALGGAVLVGGPYFGHWVFGAVLLLMVMPGIYMMSIARRPVQ